MPVTPRDILTALSLELAIIDVSGTVIETQNHTHFATGENLLERVLPVDREYLQQTLAMVVAQGSAGMCDVHLQPDVTTLFRFRLFPVVKDEHIEHVVIRLNSLSKQDGDTPDAAKLFDAIMQYSRDVVIFSHPGTLGEGLPVAISQSIENLTGYTAEETLSYSNSYSIIPDTDVSDSIHRTRGVLAGEQYEPYERRAIHKLGHEIVIETHPTIVPDEEGNPLYFLTIVRDITERKQREEALKAALKAAEAATHARDIFLANMGHELRTPLNAILGFTQVLERQLQDEKDRRMTGRIARNAKHLLYIISDILVAAQLEAGISPEMPSTRFDLWEILDDVIEVFQPLFEQKQIEFRTAIDIQPDTRIEGDDVKIRQIIANLLHNVAKFTDEGHTTLEVCITPENLLEITITDTGRGILPEEREHLFQRFYHPDPAQPGTGLGLALTKDYVELMGGEITVQSSYGVGTSFTVRIPVQYSTKPGTFTRAMDYTPLELMSDRFQMPDHSQLTEPPQEWLERFYRVALTANTAQAQQTIDEIAEDFPALAEQLTVINEEFLLVPLARHIAHITRL